jgi:hypothetical protein
MIESLVTPIARKVKGALFADYVRMIRSAKTVEWSRHLRPSDMAYLIQKIDPDGWYPMESFERMGNAILREVADLDLDAVRMWGRFSVDALLRRTPQLLAENDPVETLSRFRVLRATYFDFDALVVSTLVDDHVHIGIHYYMGATAEEAASHQTMGFFERLLELAGAREVHARFTQRSWCGDPETVLEINWQPPALRGAYS